MTIFMIVSAGASLLGTVAAAGAKPPPVATPAIAAPTNRAPGATVRLGNGDNDIKNTSDNTPADGSGDVQERSAGKAVGGLGRSGLAL